MKRLTNSEECTVEDKYQVYLAWNDMQWDIFGNITEYNEPKKDMCKRKDNITNIFLTGKKFSKFQKVMKIILFKIFTNPCQIACKLVRICKTQGFLNSTISKRCNIWLKYWKKLSTFQEHQSFYQRKIILL